MTFVNLLNNPSGRRSATYTGVFGGTAGYDPGLDAWVLANGSATAPSTVGFLLQSFTIGTALAASTTYTFSAWVAAVGTSTWLSVTGATGGTLTSTAVASGQPYTRVSITFTTPSSGTINVFVLNGSTAAAGNSVNFRDAQLEPGSVANAYVDGNSSNYMWAGTPDASKTWGPVLYVNANAISTPPRAEISASIPTGNVMKSAALYRIVDGVPVLTRSQPATGFDSRTVFDFECPYDTPATYRFDVTSTDPSALTTVWDETWANLASWGGDLSQFTVSAGKVNTAGGGPGDFEIYRSVPTPGSYRATVASLTASGTDYLSARGSGIAFINTADQTVLMLSPTLDGKIRVTGTIPGYYQGATTGISGSAPFTVDFLDHSIVVSGASGTWTISGLNGTDYTLIRVITNYQNPGTFQVGELKIAAYGSASTSTSFSATVGLSPLNSWMIHPSRPALSVPISSADRSALMIRNIGDISNPSATTEHTILGQSDPITTTSGPRFSNRLQMVLGARSRAQELALNALLADGTPVLLRFPAIFDAGFDEGFYSVGDVSRSRFAQRPGDPLRNFTLPLTQVQSPVVTVQNTGWSYAALATALAAFSVLTAAYDSFADMEVDNRNVGF